MGLGPRPVVSALAIRDYAGDCEDVAALGQKVWTATYGGTMWFPLWDAAFLRWQIGGEALAPALYDGDRLAGTFFSLPHKLRIGSQTHRVTDDHARIFEFRDAVAHRAARYAKLLRQGGDTHAAIHTQ